MGNSIDKIKKSIETGIKKGEQLTPEFVHHKIMNLATKGDLLRELNTIGLKPNDKDSKLILSNQLATSWISSGLFNSNSRGR